MLVLQRPRRNLSVSGSHFRAKNPILSRTLLSLSSNFLNFPTALLYTHSQIQQNLSHWSITSSDKLKTLACALPKSLNSFSNIMIYLWSLPSFQPLVQSLQGWGISITVQNELLPASSHSMYHYPCSLFPSLVHLSPWLINICKSLPSSIFSLMTSPFNCCFIFLILWLSLLQKKGKKKKKKKLYFSWYLHFIFSIITAQACASFLKN